MTFGADKPRVPVMTTNKSIPDSARYESAGADGFTRLLPPLPLFVLQPLLGHIVTTITRRHPELFARLGGACKKRFKIDPGNMPFFLLLQPDPNRPRLSAHQNGSDVAHDVRISGSFLTLLRMIDNQSDSDALFFSRDLTVTGDTEAIVALRNALDDMDTTLADDVAACFGPFSRPVRALFDFASKRTAQ